jgi:hypothetical protein
MLGQIMDARAMSYRDNASSQNWEKRSKKLNLLTKKRDADEE